MKIIATSIVVLAAAATTVSAGESNLRLGRDLRGKPEGPKGLAWEWRCCKDIDVKETCNGIGPGDRDNCKDDGLKDKLESKFLAGTGFYGCEWDDDEDECIASDEPEVVRHRKLPGNKPNDKGKAKGIGFYCCRGAHSAETCNTYTDDAGETVNDQGRQFANCGGNVDEEDFNKCVWTDGIDGEEGECDHVDLDSSE